jgi:hypothetical protein
MIVGAVLGSIGGMIILAVFTWLFLRRRAEIKKKKQSDNNNHPSKEVSSGNPYKHESDVGRRVHHHPAILAEVSEANNYSELPASVSSSNRSRHGEEEGLPSRSQGVNGPGLAAELD